ncbi:MAG: Holliday junction resolvase RuvX, partial [bacterium]|nr:Holliday junction resolvase RuvX [bacterium]
DYGIVHVGVALAEHMLATPLPTLVNDQSLLTKLKAIIATYQITHLVVGLPSGKLVPEIKAFAGNLNKATNLPVILHDETLSSQDATSKLVEAGASRSKKKSEHSYSAALILEDYLDSVKL